MNTPATTNHKRHPWLAASLSSVMPGLGQLYCGAIMKCLWLAGAMSAIGLLGLVVAVPGFSLNEGFLLLFLALSLLLYGYSVVDAFLLARRTGEHYQPKDYNRWPAYVLLFLAVSGGYVFSGLYVRDRLVQAFKVPSSSMYPAIWPGDKVLAVKSAYLDQDPAVGDIVIFRNPENRRQLFIKRVVAVGGDAVEIRDGNLYINDIPLKREPAPAAAVIPGPSTPPGTLFYESNRNAKYRILLNPGADDKRRNYPRTVIPKYDCFVLGDSRNDSFDSRFFGPVPIAGVVGKASFIYGPARDWSRFGRLP